MGFLYSIQVQMPYMGKGSTAMAYFILVLLFLVINVVVIDHINLVQGARALDVASPALGLEGGLTAFVGGDKFVPDAPNVDSVADLADTTGPIWVPGVNHHLPILTGPIWVPVSKIMTPAFQAGIESAHDAPAPGFEFARLMRGLEGAGFLKPAMN